MLACSPSQYHIIIHYQKFVSKDDLFLICPNLFSFSTPFQAIFSFITMQFQLCSVFFTFSLGTRTHYFGRTILHGGAKVFYFFAAVVVMLYAHVSQYANLVKNVFCQYRATGRGFVVRHIKFADNYRLYSRSHFVKA